MDPLSCYYGIGACHQALRQLLPGTVPRGFRSPGYDMSPMLRDKYRALMATLDRLQGDYEIVPLHQVAEEFHRSGAIKRHLD